MGVELLTARHKDEIAGVLSSFDRIIIQGTVPGWCYASGTTNYFYQHQLRIFDYHLWLTLPRIYGRYCLTKSRYPLRPPCRDHRGIDF
jgi:hypothetical protein